MHRPFSSNKNRSFPLPIALDDGLTYTDNSTGGIADTSENRLVEHHYSARESGVAETESRGTGFTDDYVTWFEEGAEGLQMLDIMVKETVSWHLHPTESLV